MIGIQVRVALIGATCVTLMAISAIGAYGASNQVKRGKYLVSVMGCSDCHTPGYFFGHPNMHKFLAGSDVGFSIPRLGVFPGRNLTPDNKTGLGKWTVQQIATAITTGVRPDGRILARAMPWKEFSHLKKSDALDIAAYLKSLPPIKNKVPGPFGPTEKPTVFVSTILPSSVYWKLRGPQRTNRR